MDFRFSATLEFPKQLHFSSSQHFLNLQSIQIVRFISWHCFLSNLAFFIQFWLYSSCLISITLTECKQTTKLLEKLKSKKCRKNQPRKILKEETYVCEKTFGLQQKEIYKILILKRTVAASKVLRFVTFFRVVTIFCGRVEERNQ